MNDEFKVERLTEQVYLPNLYSTSVLVPTHLQHTRDRPTWYCLQYGWPAWIVSVAYQSDKPIYGTFWDCN